MDRYHKFENYDSLRLTPRKIRRDAYRPFKDYDGLRRNLCASDIFTKYIRTRGINNSQVDYWIQDSEMRVCFIAGWIQDDITGQDWNSTLKEYEGRKEVWIDRFNSCLFFEKFGTSLKRNFIELSFFEDHFVWTDRNKKKKKLKYRGYEKWNSGEIIASRYDTRVDFTDDGARRFALTRARNEITPGIEIPARNQSETILDFNPRVTNEPIIT